MDKNILRVRIRAARAADRADAAAICDRIYEDGSDYLPQLWDEWLNDRGGQFIVAEVEGRLVGVAKRTHLADDEYWLEGLRVSPAYQGQGIAARLQAHLVDGLHRMGGGTLRFATHSGNRPVHRLAARDGFQHVATYRLYRAEPAWGKVTVSLRPLTGDDLNEAWTLIQGSPGCSAANSLYETFWSWQTLTREKLADQLLRGGGWGIDEDDTLAALALLCDTDKKDALDVSYVDGSREALALLLMGLRELAAQRGCDKVRFRAAEEPELMNAIEEAGYWESWDRELRVYETFAAGGRRQSDESPRLDAD